VKAHVEVRSCTTRSTRLGGGGEDERMKGGREGEKGKFATSFFIFILTPSILTESSTKFMSVSMELKSLHLLGMM